jgi:hypothetical protein
LPTFSDWRVAYQSPDGILHAITLDGKTDVAGPLLPGLITTGNQSTSAGASPNGQMLAYDGDGGLVILGMSADAIGSTNARVAGMYEMFWSPDGSQVAISDGVGGLSVVVPASGQPRPIPSPHGHVLGHLIGWIDGGHLAVEVVNSATAATVGALDVITGELRIIATIHSSELGTYTYSLSPDGKTLLFSNSILGNDPYTPLVAKIDTATGVITPLPRIANINRYSGFTSAAWRPGTEKIAVSTGFTANGDLKSWVLDLRNDTATHLLDGQYVDGWAPDNGPLILTVSQKMPDNDIVIGGGPFTITAATISSNGQVSTTVLTQQAMTFPFIGFVRTA